MGHARSTAASLATGVLVVLAAPLPAGCDSHPPCLPAALHLSQTTVASGDTTVLSSSASACRLRGVTGATYIVTLLTLGRAAPVELVMVHPSADGSFSVPVRIPSASPPGQAVLSVAGSAFDAACKGSNRKCADYAVGLSITR